MRFTTKAQKEGSVRGTASTNRYLWFFRNNNQTKETYECSFYSIGHEKSQQHCKKEAPQMLQQRKYSGKDVGLFLVGWNVGGLIEAN